MSPIRFALLLALATLSTVALGCSRPTVQVCRSLGAEGRCEGPLTELRVGREYVVRVAGFGLPEREAEIQLVALEGRSPGVLATRPLVRGAGKSYLENPLILPRPGRYRVEIRSERGLYASTEVRAPRPTFWVVDGGPTPIPQIQEAPPPIPTQPLVRMAAPSR